jgi:hypothetical protein
MSIDSKNQEINKPRRQFLKLVGGIAGSLIVSKLISPANDTDEEPSHSLLSKETLTKHQIDVIVNYEKYKQNVYTKMDKHGNNLIYNCDEPFSEVSQSNPIEEKESVEDDIPIFEWSDIKLPQIDIHGEESFILTSRKESSKEDLEFLERWYQNPNHVENEINKIISEEIRPQPLQAMVVYYKSTRDSYYKQEGRTCRKVFDDTPWYDPLDLHGQLTKAISESTNGIIEYETKNNIIISEEDLPLTTDLNLTFDWLVDRYGKGMNYEALAKKAVENNVSHIFVYAGPTGSMFEHKVYTDKESGKVVTIFGLNYDAPYEYALHSWSHFLEDKILTSPAGDIFKKCMGRLPEYSDLPYLTDEEEKINTEKMGGKTYASMGIGTVHLAPNSIDHYQYNSPIKVLIPGNNNQLVDSSIWGSNQEGYYKWWINSIPKPFFVKSGIGTN